MVFGSDNHGTTDLFLYIPIDSVLDILPKGGITISANPESMEIDYDSFDKPASFSDLVIKSLTAEYINDYYRFNYSYETKEERAINIFGDGIYYARKMMPGENSVSLYVPAEQVQNTSFLISTIANCAGYFTIFSKPSLA
jgi:hypothetical protein